ncbi:MAG: biotin/lipoyl-binding protein [Planctomycetaceae bacterium]|jgi:multidrug efflux pump subunit AcrA (membrane-fusion protein)|nr:biotin/lipoyl-binding protein [Planctomycetaceae bacterium]
MKWRFLVLPVLAIAGASLAVYTVKKQARPAPVAPPSGEPTRSPFGNRVAGSGLVEPVTEIVNVGTPIGGVVETVLVREGDVVKKGQELFIIDQRMMKSQLQSAKARLEVARRKLDQLKSLPRAEDLAKAEAVVEQRRAALRDAQSRLDRLNAITDPGAISANERPTREYELANAKARMTEAEADLGEVRKGAYPEDLAVAAADVQVAEAEVNALSTDLDRSDVRAPIDATILRVTARPGQFAAASSGGSEGLVTLGQLTPLNIRVDVDELDAWRFDPNGKAVAVLRGGKRVEYPIRYVRTVPVVIPKKTLTGDNAERIDTRVLQLIYTFNEPNPGVLPGQVLDVYVETGSGSGTLSSPAAPSPDAGAATPAPAGG